MIELTDINGRTVLVPRERIASVRDAGPSQRWHGVGSVIETIDGKWIEVRQSLARVRDLCSSKEEANHAS